MEDRYDQFGESAGFYSGVVCYAGSAGACGGTGFGRPGVAEAPKDAAVRAGCGSVADEECDEVGSEC